MNRPEDRPWTRLANRLTRRPVPSFPRTIQIQTFTGCNADCIFCPYGESYETQPKGKMPPELFRRIIDEAAEHGVRRISPCLMNEPLMDRDLFEKVRQRTLPHPAHCRQNPGSGRGDPQALRLLPGHRQGCLPENDVRQLQDRRDPRGLGRRPGTRDGRRATGRLNHAWKRSRCTGGPGSSSTIPERTGCAATSVAGALGRRPDKAADSIRAFAGPLPR
jgi:hypothetical protein